MQETLLKRLNPIHEDKHQSNVQVSVTDSGHVYSHDGIIQDIILGEVVDPVIAEKQLAVQDL